MAERPGGIDIVAREHVDAGWEVFALLPGYIAPPRFGGLDPEVWCLAGDTSRIVLISHFLDEDDVASRRIERAMQIVVAAPSCSLRAYALDRSAGIKRLL